MNRFEQNADFFQSLFADEDKLDFIKRMLLDNIYNELRNSDR